jgi:hypothetical protein
VHLENSRMTVCDLILGLPCHWFQPTDHFDEAIRQLQAVQDERQEADVELKAQRGSSLGLGPGAERV